MKNPKSLDTRTEVSPPPQPPTTTAPGPRRQRNAPPQAHEARAKLKQNFCENLVHHGTGLAPNFLTNFSLRRNLQIFFSPQRPRKRTPRAPTTPTTHPPNTQKRPQKAPQGRQNQADSTPSDNPDGTMPSVYRAQPGMPLSPQLCSRRGGVAPSASRSLIPHQLQSHREIRISFIYSLFLHHLVSSDFLAHF